jgi:glycerate dehydrogenase
VQQYGEQLTSESGFFMKIVILDGHAINPGDLSWDALRSLGSLEVFDRTPEDLIVPRAREAEILLTTKAPLSAQTLMQLKQLRYEGLYSPVTTRLI